MENKDRFEIIYTQGLITDIYKIIVDKETGVNYLYNNLTGITVLVDADGKPIVTKR